MTNREAKIERARLDVEKAKSKVREANNALKFGKIIALAEYNETVGKLEEELERHKSDLAREETYLKAIEDNVTDEHGDL